MMTEFDP